MTGGRHVWSAWLTCVLLAWSLWPAALAAQATTDAATALFVRRVDQYLKDRQAAVDEVGRLRVTADARALGSTARDLGDAINRARGRRGEGDIFTPAVASFLRSRLTDVLQGPAGRRVNSAVFAVQPQDWQPAVGAIYPTREPVSSMPPELLSVLPTLPSVLEYRVAGEDLLLLDRNTGLVIDVLRAAFSPEPPR